VTNIPISTASYKWQRFRILHKICPNVPVFLHGWQNTLLLALRWSIYVKHHLQHLELWTENIYDYSRIYTLSDTSLASYVESDEPRKQTNSSTQSFSALSYLKYKMKVCMYCNRDCSIIQLYEEKPLGWTIQLVEVLWRLHGIVSWKLPSNYTRPPECNRNITCIAWVRFPDKLSSKTNEFGLLLCQ
jgi:uncharacterized protein with PIN domain